MGEKQFSLIVAFDLKELNDEIFLIRDAETSDQSGSRGGLLPVGYNREPPLGIPLSIRFVEAGCFDQRSEDYSFNLAFKNALKFNIIVILEGN